MLLRILKDWLHYPESGSPPPEEKASHRPGATAMEYLVAISFILVVLILAVQHLGFFTGGLMGDSAKATNFTGS